MVSYVKMVSLSYCSILMLPFVMMQDGTRPACGVRWSEVHNADIRTQCQATVRVTCTQALQYCDRHSDKPRWLLRDHQAGCACAVWMPWAKG